MVTVPLYMVPKPPPLRKKPPMEAPLPIEDTCRFDPTSDTDRPCTDVVLITTVNDSH
jgi:hypothetical protein